MAIALSRTWSLKKLPTLLLHNSTYGLSGDSEAVQLPVSTGQCYCRIKGEMDRNAS